jgi:putative ATP-dependent endonuclease of the OLD family
MRIARVQLRRFRGYADMVLLPGRHVVVVGESRAGRTDLITALRRVLDPRSTTARPNLLDVHRPLPASSDEEPLPPTEVEVTLLDLGTALEQDLDDRLEVLHPQTGLLAEEADAESAVMGLRLCYRLHYDDVTDTAEHWVEYPASGTRVPRAEREALRAEVLDRAAPLQLRADGVFRRLATDVDEAGLLVALGALGTDVAAAAEKLAGSSAVRQTVAGVLAEGSAQLLEMSGIAPEDDVGFVAEDGSVAAILRAIQPTLALDGAGPLPLASHGSTTTGVLAAAEAALAARAPGAVVLADDFGDDLDAASAEYLAARLRRYSGQVWLSTRRPEVLRAFPPEEVLRLTRSHGHRCHHQLGSATDRKARAARRQLHLLLLPAMTARAVALLEGPHDLEGYTAIADSRLLASGTPPPAAYGVRMVAAGIGDGGKEQLPKLARLAGELGFHVRVVLDHDKPGTDAALLAELATLAEQVIRLPERTSIERALVHNVPPANLRVGLQRINAEYGLGINVDDIPDDDLETKIIGVLKQKGGLHQPFVDALPPKSHGLLAMAVLDTLVAPPLASVLVEIPEQ